MRARSVPGLLCLVAVACGAPARDQVPPFDVAVAGQAAASVSGDELRAIVETLSDDRMEGRGPDSDGDLLAREYMSGYMARLGLAPGADGSWEQPFEMVTVTADMPATWSFSGPGGQLDLSWWDDFVATSGVQAPRVEVPEAELVFVGYGIVAPQEQWDDYKGVDLTGKILVMLNNDPDWDPALFAGTRRLYYGRWTYKYESAARQRAAGAIIIHTDDSAGYPFQVVQGGWSGKQFELSAGDEARLPLNAWVTGEAADRLFSMGGHDLDRLRERARGRDFRPVPLGITTTIGFSNTVAAGARTANVLGLLRGRDPELRDEVVVYTAHHDHMGVGEPDDRGDAIYNGARDNASGVATVLGVARAFSALPEPPRRSILFLLVAAEEQGLLGSSWYCRHPTVHPGRIAANLNFDSANIFGPTRDVAVIGRGKSELEDLLETFAESQGRIVVDEPFPDKGYYYRSDQFNFANIGVPALYFKGGTDFIGRDPAWGRQIEDEWRATRYHQPSDEIYEAWSFEGMAEDARLAFMVGLAVAEADDPPSWRPGDEFEALRKRMVDEAHGSGAATSEGR